MRGNQNSSYEGEEISMSHELEIKNGKAQMVYTGLAPWHGLGTKVDHAMTGREAEKLAGIDSPVRGERAFIPTRWENTLQQDGTFKVEPMDFIPVPNAMVNIRESDKSILGVVTDRYKICQNADAFDFVDALIGQEGGAHFHTAGSLFDGKRVWMLAKMTGVTILGDQVEPFLLFENSHDGSTGVRVCLTPIRVVCNNTLTMAISGSKRIWSTHHTGDMNAKLEEARETLRAVKVYMEKMPEVATAMYEANVYADEIPKILEALFPDPVPKIKNGVPEPVSPQTIINIQQARQDVFNIYSSAPDQEKFEGTSWGMYNALAAYQQHVRPINDTVSARENRFVRAMEGDPLLGQAQKILAQLVKK